MIKLSIVIPVYNSEDYLVECLDSIINQNESEYEIICVDDGSTDNSFQILKEYEQKYHHIRVISQTNKYAGAARNEGLKHSAGKYVWFVDSDDIVNDESISIIFEITKKTDVPIIIFNYCSFTDDLTKSKDVILYKLKEPTSLIGKTSYEIMPVVNNEHKLIATSVVPWNKIYKKSHLLDNNIIFDEIRSANDRSFYFKTISKAENVAICDYKLVNYRKNLKNSLTGKMDLARLECCIEAYTSSKNYITDDELKNEIFKATVTDMVALHRKSTQEEKWAIFKKMINIFNNEMSSKPSDIWKTNEAYSLYHLYRYSQYLLNKEESKLVPIVLATDLNYLPYAAVTIQSIIDNSNSDLFYDIYILHSSRLMMRNIERIRKMSKQNIHITFVNIAPMIESKKLYSRAHYSKEMFNRIIIPEIFCYYKKICYVDCDIILRDDIANFYKIDTENNAIVATKNESNEEMSRYIRNVLKLEVTKYFNSGVLLFDTFNYNEQNIKQKCFDLLEKNTFYVCPDQDALNVACCDSTKILPNDDWNFQWFSKMIEGYNSSYHGQKIIHYTSGKKAWNSPDFDLAYLFWECARKTTFYEEILYTNILSKQNIDRISNDTINKINNKRKKENRLHKIKNKINSKIKVKNLLYKIKNKIHRGKP